jgi:uncharacterized protein (DUF952 family)
MILHFCPRAEWEAAVVAGSYAAPSLAAQGYIHCSTRAQVPTPANLLARGRTDLVLLRIDGTRLTSPLVWEDGDPPDPSGTLFPHVYGPILASAVVGVYDFPPSADGSFTVPADVPED